MFYKANQPSTSVSDWIDLHTQAIPTEAIAALYPASYISGEGELQRLDVTTGPTECEACEGIGTRDEHGPNCDPECSNQNCDPECAACGGLGEIEPDEAAGELHAYPAAWGTSWRVENRDAVRDAAISAGFVVYAVDGGPLDGDLILCVDGAGYSFYGQHWIPLRAELARQQCRANEDPTAWGFIREALRAAADREGETLRFDRMFPVDLDGGAS